MATEMENSGGTRRLNVKGFFIGMGVGAVVGGVVALLFAPRSGRDTREMIRGKAVETQQMIQSQINNIKEKAVAVGQSLRSSPEK